MRNLYPYSLYRESVSVGALLTVLQDGAHETLLAAGDDYVLVLHDDPWRIVCPQRTAVAVDNAQEPARVELLTTEKSLWSGESVAAIEAKSGRLIAGSTSPASVKRWQSFRPDSVSSLHLIYARVPVLSVVGVAEIPISGRAKHRLQTCATGRSSGAEYPVSTGANSYSCKTNCACSNGIRTRQFIWQV